MSLPDSRSFGSTVNQAVVHPSEACVIPILVFRRYGNPGSSSPTMDDVRGHSMFRRYRKSSSSSPHKRAGARQGLFRKYRKPSSSSPDRIDLENQVVFRRYGNPNSSSPSFRLCCLQYCFGDAAIQAVVHRLRFSTACRGVSDVP